VDRSEAAVKIHGLPVDVQGFFALPALAELRREVRQTARQIGGETLRIHGGELAVQIDRLFGSSQRFLVTSDPMEHGPEIVETEPKIRAGGVRAGAVQLAQNHYRFAGHRESFLVSAQTAQILAEIEQPDRQLRWDRLGKELCPSVIA